MSYYELIMLVIGAAGLVLQAVPAAGTLRLSRIKLTGTGVFIASVAIIVMSLVPLSFRLSGVFDQSFSMPGRVRCAGGGLFGNGESRSTTITYTAPAGTQIIDYTTEELRRADGTTGNINTILDDEGRLRTVTVQISCHARNRVGGGGAWNDTNLVGTIRYDWLAL